MNKKIIFLLLATLMGTSSFAISVKSDPSQTTSSTSVNSVKDVAPVEQLNKSGRVNLVDLSSHLLIVNDVRYTLANNVKIYDGTLQAKKFVRFLMSPNKEIIEIWVHK